jgi:hypothetical protein
MRLAFPVRGAAVESALMASDTKQRLKQNENFLRMLLRLQKSAELMESSIGAERRRQNSRSGISPQLLGRWARDTRKICSKALRHYRTNGFNSTWERNFWAWLMTCARRKLIAHVSGQSGEPIKAGNTAVFRSQKSLRIAREMTQRSQTFWSQSRPGYGNSHFRPIQKW